MKKPSHKIIVIYITLAFVPLSLFLKYGIMEVCGLVTITLNALFYIRQLEKAKGLMADIPLPDNNNAK